MSVQLIHEVHDIWPETLTTIGNMSKRHPFIRILQFAEDSAYKNSDKVVSMLPYAKGHMISHGMRADKFVYIPNGIDIAEWQANEQIPKSHKIIIEQLKEKKKFIAGYFGGHALSNCLDVLLSCAEKLKNSPDIVFLFVGDGVEKPNLIKMAQSRNCTNVLFLDSVKKTQIPNLTSYFDCILMSTKASPLYRYGINMNKMFDAMMTRKPIILSVTTKKTPIEKYKCGYVIKAGDVRGIVKCIEKLYRMNPEERAEIGERGRKAAERYFTYHALANKFEEVWH